MRNGTIALVVVALLAVGGVAAAEKVTTNQRAELYSRPGEASRILIRVKEGQAMTVVAREGRWLKVRVKGRTGYVPRSKIDEDRSDRIDRNTRRRPFVDGRSTERGWAGGAPEDRIGEDAVDVDRGDKDDDDDDDDDDRGKDRDRDDDDDDRRASRDDDDDRGDKDDDDRGDKDDDDDRDRDDDEDQEEERPTVKVTAKRVTLYDRPSKGSEEMGTARKGDTFFFMREDGSWVMVENDEGDAVWVKSASVSRDGGSGGRAREGRQIIGTAGLGVKLLGQVLRTPGGANPTTPPDNYKLGTSAATIAIGGEIMFPYGSQYLIGGTLEYAGSKAVPGIAYDGSNTGLTIHDIDLRVMGGYDLKNDKGMIAYARLGYHYEKFGISSVEDFTKNTAMIPSEIFSAPTIGGAFDVTNLTKSLAMRVSLDAVVFGAKRKQTRNLEDGSDPSVKGAWLSGLLAYKWKPNMTINGVYELTYMKTDFGAQAVNSMRHPGATGNTSRRDLNHAVIVMMARQF